MNYILSDFEFDFRGDGVIAQVKKCEEASGSHRRLPYIRKFHTIWLLFNSCRRRFPERLVRTTAFHDSNIQFSDKSKYVHGSD